jgi:arylsulfatase A-like enzyme
MVDFADAAIGNFTEAIKAKGMWDDMIIVFSAGTNERPL